MILRERKIPDLTWHEVFAFFPIWVQGKLVWLEPVERRFVRSPVGYAIYYPEFRLKMR